MSLRNALRSLLLIAAMCLLASIAWAQSHVRIVHLSYIEGDAQIKHAGSDAVFSHAVLNMPVTEGMALYTPVGGRAEVQFENGSTLRLADDAQAQFTKLFLNEAGGKIESVALDHGVLYANFQKSKNNDEMVISAGAKEFRVAKSAHFRIEADEKSVTVAVFHGDVMLDGAVLKSGEASRFDVAESSAPQIAKIEKLPTDNFDKKRNDDIAQLPSPTAAPYNGYNSQFGLLNGYGNFMNVPGYGLLWQPSNMAFGWNPYADGLWGFYPGMGYAWISPYAWGWLPYRYGQWMYNPAFGWAWQPGSAATAWNVGPRYASAPKGFTAPLAPVALGSIKPGHLLIVGNPPNLHPAITAGKAEIGAKPLTTPVSANSGLAALHTPKAKPAFDHNPIVAHGDSVSSVQGHTTQSTPSHTGNSHPK